MRYTLILFSIVMLAFCGNSYSQESNTISGVVTESLQGTPLPGVNIIEKGTQNGTVTDINGRYTITTKTENPVLEYSYVGFLTEEMSAAGKSEINMTMAEDIAKLDEVLVIGYGTMRKSDLTAAVVSLDEEELQERAATSFESALQGKAAGVYITQNNGAPGGNMSVTIRGISSLSGSNEPLYVVDGVPIFNDNFKGTEALNVDRKGGTGQRANLLATLNPNDIESIEILKDAAASAVYGARASNGVVLITTKRGQQGKTKFSFSSYYGVLNRPNKLDLLNAREYAILANERTVNFRGGVGLAELPFPELDSLPETDWQDVMYRQGTKQNYQLSASGGNENVIYSFSGGYYNEEGILVSTDFTRYSVKSNLDFNLGDRFKLGSTLNLSQVEDNQAIAEGGDGLVFRALSSPPVWELKDENGVYQGAPPRLTWVRDNPLAEALESTNFSVRKRALGNLFAELEIFKNLKFRSNFGFNVLDTKYTGHVPAVTTGGRPTIPDAKARKTYQTTNFWINENYLTYNKTFGARHDVTLMAGNTSQYEKFESLTAFGERIPAESIMEVFATTNTETRNFEGSIAEESLLSYFGRLIYKFDNKVVITGIIRRDGSSKFGPNNKWSVFPSVSMAYKISEEDFFSNAFPFISQMKIRAGYGEVGNQEIGNYRYSATLRQIEIGWNGLLNYGQRLAGLPNPNLKWETSIQKNIGIDLGLWNNQVQVIAEYYHKLNKDMLLYKPVLSTQGGSLGIPPVNAGDMKNEGVELTIISNNITNSDFYWKTNVNGTYNTNKVLRLDGEEITSSLWFLGAYTRTIEGESAAQYYGWIPEGIFKNEEEIKTHAFQNKSTAPGDIKFKDLNGDNKIDDADQTFIGNPLPKFIFGMNNYLGYKNFELSFFIQGVADVDAYNVSRRLLTSLTTYDNQLSDVEDRFRTEPLHMDPSDPSTPVILGPNPDGTIPLVNTRDSNQNGRASTRFVEDASYARLQNVTLSYNLPQNLLKRVKLDNIRVYVKGENLLTLTKYSGYDPEIGAFDQNLLLSGIDFGRYPTPRSFLFGIDVNF